MCRVFLICFLSFHFISAQSNLSKSEWIEQRFIQLTLDEKIGQLFIVRAYGKNDTAHIQRVTQLIKEYYIGGLCFFQGQAETQAQLTNYYQSISNTPLFISMDAEWSLGMRLKSDGFSYPRQLCLGAIQDNYLIYEMGRDIGRQLRRIGVNYNFAPVVDINSNPQNPVINERSFGEDRINVVGKSYAYMKGLQDEKVLACAKHFPGHGDTDKDSHLELPKLSHHKDRLDSIELFPFKVLCEQNIASVMVAHLDVPSLENQSDKPSTLSHSIITGILKDQYHYHGLIITDALEMKAVAQRYEPGQLELACFQAGNDILLLSENIEKAIDLIKQKVLLNEISLDELDSRVRKILSYKYNVNLHQLGKVQEENLQKEINSNSSLALKEKLYRNAVTLIKDNKKSVPFRNLNKNFVSINFGSEETTNFQYKILKYVECKNYTSHDFKSIKNAILNSADEIIISLHQLNFKANQNYGLKPEELNFINELCNIKRVHIVIFGAPYVAELFLDASSILLAYENNNMIQNIAAEMIFGTDPIIGLLPVNVGASFKKGYGIRRPSLMRLGYSVPETQGMNSDTLHRIEEIAEQIIKINAAPGGQILVAKNNKIVYQHNFGTLNDDSTTLVTDSTLYDVASLTKILASAPVLMQLDDLNLFSTNKTLGFYIPGLDSSNKADIVLKDAMLHQAKLLSWIPYYKSTLILPDSLNILDSTFYRNTKSDSFSIQVTEKLFLRSDYKDTILTTIIKSRLHETRRFFYSDLFFYFVPGLIKRLTNLEFDKYLYKNFYKKLGLRNTYFNPLTHGVNINNVAPSEKDTYFRQQELRACVHDMGAAMFGGISGHAGIFSNAEEVAIIMQCYLNYGNYGGLEYLSNSIVKKYTQRDAELRRRALLFDMPEELNIENPSVSNLTPKSTFGHTGFTGTCTWADPENNIVYVFLSNRTYPQSQINTLHKYRYRVKIQDLIYKSLIQ